MGHARCIGRVGALAVALGVGNVRRTATRMTVSIGAVALVVMAAAAPVPTAAASSPPCTETVATCALILGGTTLPTPDDYYIDTVRNQFIAPTHPGQIGYDAVTTPQELWPLTGVARLLLLALGPPELAGLDGPAWPDEPLWKLSGLFDLTANQSVQAGAAALEDAIAEHPNDHLVILGYSQGAGVANEVKRNLAKQYPAGTTAPDIDFVLLGDPNLPNGGLMSRFAGAYIPILDFPFNGPAPTNTQFDTVEINRQYDGFTDFPLYPLNLVATLNAVLGIVYVHGYLFDVSLPADDPTSSPAYQGKYGDTSYYFFESDNLPLFGPLRTLGVPEPVIDVFEPFFKVIVDTAYDRSIPPWEPTAARLIPQIDPVKVAANLVGAIGEGINNAAALIGAPAALSKPAPTKAKVDEQPSFDRERPAIRDQINKHIAAVKSALGNGRTIARSAGSGKGLPASTAGPLRKALLRDAAKDTNSDIKKSVTKVSDRIKKAFSSGKDKDTKDRDQAAEQ